MRRHLLLNGFMATGKSTVGRLVAARTGRGFVDLDGEIERAAARSVADIFREDGEAAFRSLERQQLLRLLGDGQPQVVALGGGALLRRDIRLHALDRAVVVTLTASPEEVVRRTAGKKDRPLLDVEDPAARIAELLELRRAAYVEAHARVRTDDRRPEEVADEVVACWERDPVAVAAGEHSYGVEIGPGLTAERLPALLRNASAALLVTDANVARHHATGVEAAMQRGGVRTERIVLEPGEAHKNVRSLERIWSAALAAGADRKSVLVALGGGVVTDIAGFAAATWMRGVRWIALPTTLLAMVDASVGGKTAVDLEHAKNAVGAFWQPGAVLCDVSTLATEPDRGYRSALSEVVKTALIGDAELLELVEREAEGLLARDPDIVGEVVRRSIRVKARIVSLDEREGGLRACLNLGHTVGHALEACGGYGRLRHGEAVSLGLVAALRLGESWGDTSPALTRRVTAVLERLGLPVSLADEPLEAAAALIGHDKKRAGSRLRFVVALEAGRVELRDVELEAIRSAAAALGR